MYKRQAPVQVPGRITPIRRTFPLPRSPRRPKAGHLPFRACAAPAGLYASGEAWHPFTMPFLCPKARACRRQGILPRRAHAAPAGYVRQTETLYHITRKRGTAASGALHSPCLHLFQMRTRPYIDGTCTCRGAHLCPFSFIFFPFHTPCQGLLLSPPLLSVKCFPAVFGGRRQAYLSCTPRGRERAY